MRIPGATLKVRLVSVAIASLLGGSVQAQQAAPPKAGQPSAVFLKTTEATRAAFCRNARLLACLQLDQVKCQAQIAPIVNTCAKDSGPAISTTQSEGLVYGYLNGCILGAFLAANPQRSKEATACIQQAGKK
jgi:hypothetical protein